MHAGLYVHLPFCDQKCGYCDFFVVAGRNQEIPAYLDALAQEARLYADDPRVAALTFDTLYFGGGTPSLLSVEQMAATIQLLLATFHFSGEVEITVEANPENVDAGKLAGYRAAGVNRLSLGAQSFHADQLALLDRTHSGDQVARGVRLARKAGLDNLNLDLIFGVPGQTPADWRDDLQKALALTPDHLSVYNLTFEPKTPLTHKLHRGELRPVPEDQQWQMYETTLDMLTSQGYEQYEISNFARHHKRSRHNQKYWNGTPYLGLGASSHSFLDSTRFWNVRGVRKYYDRLRAGQKPVAGEEQLGSEQAALERVFLALRQTRGLDLRAFEAEFGVAFFERYARALARFFDRALADGQLRADLLRGKRNLRSRLLAFENGFLKLTREGLFLANAVCAEFA